MLPHTYGFWFYNELVPVLGINKLITLDTPAYGPFPVTATGSRLRCLLRSPKCVSCGLEGVMWMLQSHRPLNPKSEPRPHLNLYAYTDKGEWVMMTQDHIFPKSKGGSNELSNLQREALTSLVTSKRCALFAIKRRETRFPMTTTQCLEMLETWMNDALELQEFERWKRMRIIWLALSASSQASN